MDHVCRYCVYFKEGSCTAKKFLSESSYQISEDGELFEVITETIEGGELFKALDKILTNYKMAKIRRDSIKQLITSLLPYELDENISKLYQNIPVKIKIAEPDNFFCSEWR